MPRCAPGRRWAGWRYGQRARDDHHDRRRGRRLPPRGRGRRCSSPIGPDGYPDPVGMWFVVDDGGVLWMRTYAASPEGAATSQRDPRVAVLVESGDPYPELRGVQLTGRMEIVDDIDRICGVFAGLMVKYEGMDPAHRPRRYEGYRAKAPKQRALRLHVDRTSCRGTTRKQAALEGRLDEPVRLRRRPRSSSLVGTGVARGVAAHPRVRRLAAVAAALAAGRRCSSSCGTSTRSPRGTGPSTPTAPPACCSPAGCRWTRCCSSLVVPLAAVLTLEAVRSVKRWEVGDEPPGACVDGVRVSDVDPA